MLMPNSAYMLLVLAPEFATSLMAVVKGRVGMLLGNLIGSDLFNLRGAQGVLIP